MTRTNDEIKKGLECCAKGNSCRGHCPYDGRSAGIKECTSQLARDALTLIPRWISAKERLPEICKHVIVFKQRKALGGMAAPWWHIETDWRGEDDWSKNPGEGPFVITHWMPLPEPPKEAGHAENG